MRTGALVVATVCWANVPQAWADAPAVPPVAMSKPPVATDAPVAAAGTLLSDDTFDYRAGALTLDAGLLVGFPAALPTGLSKGITAGVTFCRCGVAFGARASWGTATESTREWTVTHADYHLAVDGMLQHDAGRGTVGIRLALGGTLVHETRTNVQGMRAGLTGDALETTAFALLPVANLDAVIGLHVAGAWLVMVSGGPAVDVHDSALHGGWSAELGVAWQP